MYVITIKAQQITQEISFLERQHVSTRAGHLQETYFTSTSTVTIDITHGVSLILVIATVFNLELHCDVNYHFKHHIYNP
jgi:hypothetical protein